jgi:hypothetical protein
LTRLTNRGDLPRERCRIFLRGVDPHFAAMRLQLPSADNVPRS